jgi:anti-sigma regulatory factor (Ser/Thr protein kinase)/DNA-binding MarR family transcriptional regulator
MKNIRSLIISEIKKHPQDLVTFISKQAKVSRTAVFKHVKKLIEEKIIENISEKKTRAEYRLVNNIKNNKFKFIITKTLTEDTVWIEKIKPVLQDLPQNMYQICQYAFTEMFNNAIDHSEGKRITVLVEFGEELKITISDDGIGIFKKIKKAFNLIDSQESILHLSKGKLTTDSTRHSGEGIFFTSRVTDSFSVISDKLEFTRFADEDWLLKENNEVATGTLVSFSLKYKSKNSLLEIFQKYAPTIESGFSKTKVIVELSKLSDELYMSRSQAKRVLFNLEKFKHITLDFNNVETVGQGFVDEIFRVFANANPNIHIEAMNMNKNVDFMVNRSLNTLS